MKFSRRNFLKAASQGIALTAVGIGSAKRVIAALPQAPPSVPLALPSPIAFEKATFLNQVSLAAAEIRRSRRVLGRPPTSSKSGSEAYGTSWT